MPDDDKVRRGRGAETARSSERPFDIWLQKQLHAMYDEIASEPLPNDLLGLIDRDAAKTNIKKGDLGRRSSGNKK